MVESWVSLSSGNCACSQALLASADMPALCGMKTVPSLLTSP